MADFREGTLILYSLVTKSPSLILSIGIASISITIATLITAIVNINLITVVLLSGILSFCSLFFLTKYFTPIFIPERNTRNCAAIASFTTMLFIIFMLVALFSTLRILLFGLPFVFLITYTYLGIFSRARLLKRFIISVLQPTLVFLIFFRINPGLLFSLIYSFNILIISVGIIFVEKTLDAPMMHLINMIWNDGVRVLLSNLMNSDFSIEDANPELGERTNLPVKLLKISDSTIVFPAVHPGPFGELGGARMPSVLSEQLKGKVFTLHTPTTHDFNPIRKIELNKIVEAVKKADFSKIRTCSRLITKSNKQDTIRVHLQVFGKKKPIAFISLELLDIYGDVGYELSEITYQIAKNFGYEDVFIADAHNYFTKNEKSVRLGTNSGNVIKFLISEALIKGIKLPQYQFEFASIKKSLPFNENDGFGRDGIGIFAFRVMNETTIYLYFDGNSMLPNIYKRISKFLKKEYNNGIILTTDTHTVHTMSGGYNPIGKNIAFNRLEKIIKELLKNLEFKKETVNVAITTANLWIWSPDMGTRYLQTLDTTLVTAKWFLPAILGLSLLCTLLITILA